MLGDIVLKKADMFQGKKEGERPLEQSRIQGNMPSHKWCDLI